MDGISVVQVNPYAVKQTKELEDNSQLKDDRKDPKLIANLVKDGNYGMPYLPEDVYAELRRLSMLRDQLTEDQPQRAQTAEVLALLGSKVGSIPCGRIQDIACVLYDEAG